MFKNNRKKFNKPHFVSSHFYTCLLHAKVGFGEHIYPNPFPKIHPLLKTSFDIWTCQSVVKEILKEILCINKQVVEFGEQGPLSSSTEQIKLWYGWNRVWGMYPLCGYKGQCPFGEENGVKPIKAKVFFFFSNKNIEFVFCLSFLFLFCAEKWYSRYCTCHSGSGDPKGPNHFLKLNKWSDILAFRADKLSCHKILQYPLKILEKRHVCYLEETFCFQNIFLAFEPGKLS